jgi:ditrans,polycis-polyprenyl diphosphate synthase
MNATRKNTNAVLNICCPYTSSHEIAAAMNDVKRGYQMGLLELDDIDSDLISESLFSGDLPPLQMLIRTSGEVRLSNFMLWQASESCYIYFTQVLWPDFNFWGMLQAILLFQFYYIFNLFNQKELYKSRSIESQNRIDKFLSWLRNDRNRNPLNY